MSSPPDIAMLRSRVSDALRDMGALETADRFDAGIASPADIARWAPGGPVFLAACALVAATGEHAEGQREGREAMRRDHRAALLREALRVLSHDVAYDLTTANGITQAMRDVLGSDEERPALRALAALLHAEAS